MVVVAAQNELHFLSCPAQPYRLPASSRHSQRSHFPVLLSKKFRSLTRTTKRKKLFISVPNVWMKRRGKEFLEFNKTDFGVGGPLSKCSIANMTSAELYTPDGSRRGVRNQVIGLMTEKLTSGELEIWIGSQMDSDIKFKWSYYCQRQSRTFIIVSRNILSNPMSKERHQKQSSLIFSSFIWKYYS